MLNAPSSIILALLAGLVQSFNSSAQEDITRIRYYAKTLLGQSEPYYIDMAQSCFEMYSKFVDHHIYDRVPGIMDYSARLTRISLLAPSEYLDHLSHESLYQFNPATWRYWRVANISMNKLNLASMRMESSGLAGKPIRPCELQQYLDFNARYIKSYAIRKISSEEEYVAQSNTMIARIRTGGCEKPDEWLMKSLTRERELI